MRVFPIVAMTALLGGCSEDVTGHWCGKRVDSDVECTGDEIGMLLLNQSGNEVDGQACEAHDHDCHVIEKGMVSGENLQFHYSFKDGYVDAELKVMGDRLVGTYYASKCKCDLQQVYYLVR